MSGQGNGPELPAQTSRQKKFRSACDICHQSKVKCSGGNPCDGCRRLGIRCKYSASNRTGRPKGVRNKKTIERIKHLQREASQESDEFAEMSNSKDPHLPTEGSGYQNPISLADNSSKQLWNIFTGPDSGNLQSGDSFALTEFDPSNLFSQDESMNPNLFEYLPPDAIQNATPEQLLWIIDMSNPPDLDALEKDNGHNNKGNSKDDTLTRVEPFAIEQQPNFSFPTCDCLQQLTDQVANFKRLTRTQEPRRPDFVLLIARDALTCWRRHLQCTVCQRNNDKDILVLSVMAMRAVLDLIQGVSRSDSQLSENSSQGHTYQPRQNSDDLKANGSPDRTVDFDNSFLGMYELAGEENQLVVDLLLYKTLRNISRIVEHIKERNSKNDYRERFASTATSTTAASTPSLMSRFDTPPSPMTNFRDPLGLPSSEDMDYAYANPTLNEEYGYLQQSLQGLTRFIETLLDGFNDDKEITILIESNRMC